MAIYRDDAGYLIGELADSIPEGDAGELMCRAMYRSYGCTQLRHCAEYPHLAGTGQDIVAIWWEDENEGHW